MNAKNAELEGLRQELVRVQLLCDEEQEQEQHGQQLQPQQYSAESRESKRAAGGVHTVKFYDNIEFTDHGFERTLDRRRLSQLDESSRYLNHALEQAYNEGFQVGGGSSKDIGAVNYEGYESAAEPSALCGTCQTDATDARRRQVVNLYRLGKDGRIEAGPGHLSQGS